MYITDFTKNGKCSNCGECCSDLLHLGEEEIKRIDDFLKDKNIKQYNKNNFKCPFRNDVIKMCNIYPARPDICRWFVCNKEPEQVARERDLRNYNKKVRSMTELFFYDTSRKATYKKIGITVYGRNE